ncbi:MAG: hypothetical protein R3F54_19875 [Alphaproteobacteria bacterium]
MLRTTALLVASSALAIGIAQAEPVVLSDGQMDVVSAAGPAWVKADKKVYIDEDINKHVDIKKYKHIKQYVDLFGYYADADGAANCFGPACETLTYAITDTNALEYYSTSVSGSESAAMPFYFKPQKPDYDQKPRPDDMASGHPPAVE